MRMAGPAANKAARPADRKRDDAADGLFLLQHYTTSTDPGGVLSERHKLSKQQARVCCVLRAVCCVLPAASPMLTHDPIDVALLTVRTPGVGHRIRYDFQDGRLLHIDTGIPGSRLPVDAERRPRERCLPPVRHQPRRTWLRLISLAHTRWSSLHLAWAQHQVDARGGRRRDGGSGAGLRQDIVALHVGRHCTCSGSFGCGLH